MSRWSRPIGLLASALFLVAIALLAVLRGGDGLPEPEGPAPDLRNGRIFIQDNLWTANRRQYAVWVAPDGTPYAGTRPTGAPDWKVVNLARLPGNPLAAPTDDDNHNVYSLGADAEGGVHIAGNMHADPLRFVTADAALGDWSTAPAPASGDEVTYPMFAALPDGRLLFLRREGSPLTGGAIMVDALDPGSSAWRPLGVILDGRAAGESPYLHHVAVDARSGVVHLLFEWRSGATFAANQDVQYMRSADGGESWQRSDGAPLATPVNRETAETVIAARLGSGLLNNGGLTVDAAGVPHGTVSFFRPSGERAVEHVWLADDGWQREEVDESGLEGRTQVVGTPDGRVWMLGVRGTILEAIDISVDRERAETRAIARVPAGWEPNFDSQALDESGVVQMLIPRGRRPHVVTADLGT
jgi:hypothetical protein